MALKDTARDREGNRFDWPSQVLVVELMAWRQQMHNYNYKTLMNEQEIK